MRFAAWLVASLATALAAPSASLAASADDLARFDDPGAKSTGTGADSRVVVEAGDADAKATLRAVFSHSDIDVFRRIGITVKAPFDSDKDDKVDIGSLSGLTAGTSATLEFGRFRFPQVKLADQNALTAECEKDLPQFIPGYDWQTVGPLQVVHCNSEMFDKEKLSAAVAAIKERAKKCQQCTDTSGPDPSSCAVLTEAYIQACPDGAGQDSNQTALCSLVGVQRQDACAECRTMAATCAALEGKPDAALAANIDELLAARQSVSEVRRLLRATYPPLWGLTFSLTGNRQRFQYVLDTAPTTPLKDQESGLGVALTYTYIARTSAILFGYSHEESYQAGGKSQVCSPLGTTGSLTCSEASIGAPSREKAEIAFFENRRLFAAGKFGFAPRVEYDFKKSVWAARMPLYFVTNKDKELTAGIALGYSEAEDDEWGVAVFIGKAFTFSD